MGAAAGWLFIRFALSAYGRNSRFLHRRYLAAAVAVTGHDGDGYLSISIGQNDMIKTAFSTKDSSGFFVF